LYYKNFVVPTSPLWARAGVAADVRRAGAKGFDLTDILID